MNELKSLREKLASYEEICRTCEDKKYVGSPYHLTCGECHGPYMRGLREKIRELEEREEYEKIIKEICESNITEKIIRTIIQNNRKHYFTGGMESSLSTAKRFALDFGVTV